LQVIRGSALAASGRKGPTSGGRVKAKEAWLGGVTLPLKLGASLGVSVFLIEMIIMLFKFLPAGHIGGAVDAVLLTAAASPIVYLALIRPLATQIAERDLARVELVQAHAQLEDFSHGLELRVAERTHELAAVNRVSTALSHCLTTDEVLQIGLKLACEAVVSQAGVVWLTRSGGVLELVAKQQLGDEVAERLDKLARQQPELRRALASRLPTLLEGSKMPALDEVLGAGDGCSRLVVVPLLSRGSVLGALGLVLPPSALSNKGTQQLEQAIGAQLGVAVENALQYDSARYLAERDSVTGLRNHRSLHKRLEEEFK
jgi:hypothetical protein